MLRSSSSPCNENPSLKTKSSKPRGQGLVVPQRHVSDHYHILQLVIHVGKAWGDALMIFVCSLLEMHAYFCVLLRNEKLWKELQKVRGKDDLDLVFSEKKGPRGSQESGIPKNIPTEHGKGSRHLPNCPTGYVSSPAGWATGVG